jgi:hypothetical protein
LREYKALIYVESRYQSVALDIDVARTFFQSTIYALFEELDLFSMYLGGEGFGELLKNASSMQNLKRLKLDGIYERKIGMVAVAGTNGAWPLLESFSFKMYVPFSNERDCELNQHRMKTASVARLLPEEITSSVAWFGDRYSRGSGLYCRVI